MYKDILFAGLIFFSSFLKVHAQEYYTDSTGTFYSATNFENGIAKISIRGLWGIIDTTGKAVTNCQFSSIGNFNDAGLAPVQYNEKWGYINRSGRIVIPYKYEHAFDFHENRAAVLTKTGWGFIDKTGKEIIPCKYSSVGNFQFGIARCALGMAENYKKQTGKIIYIDKNGNELRNNTTNKLLKYNYELNFTEGVAKIIVDEGENSGTNFINQNGDVIFSTNFKYANDCNEGLIVVLDESEKAYQSKTTGWKCFRKNGDLLFNTEYIRLSSFSEGKAVVGIEIKNGMDDLPKIAYGVIDTLGNEIFSCEFEQMKSFKNGTIPAKLNGKWGIVDSYGNLILPFEFDETNCFYDGYSLVRKGNNHNGVNANFFVDKNGNQLKTLIPVLIIRQH